jgi:hypothetical protein
MITEDETRLDATMEKIPYWDKKENKAKVLLRMYIKDIIIPHIRDAQASTET